MSDNIKEKYRNIPKEYYGSISSNRFSYQRFWGILKAFELYKTDNDFYVVFEGSEDIDIVTDSIHLYQVKTIKDKIYYTLGLMKKCSEKVSKSPLSKLAEKEQMDGVASLNIVSNLPFEHKYRKEGVDYNKAALNFTLFNDSFSSLVSSYVMEKNGFVPDLSKYYFIHSLLPLNDTRRMVIGHAVRFFNGYNAPASTIELFVDLIERDTEEMMNKEECNDHLSDKALSRSKMTEYLNRFSSSRNKIVEECNEIIEQFPVSAKNQIHRCLIGVINDNFNSMIINENKKIVIQYIFSHLDELSKLDREKDWCEHISQKVFLPNIVSDGDKLCFIILAVNDYSKGRVSRDE